MKNNKTLGLHGFPAEFYKMFWKELQIFILRTLNESCLPKGNNYGLQRKKKK